LPASSKLLRHAFAVAGCFAALGWLVFCGRYLSDLVVVVVRRKYIAALALLTVGAAPEHSYNEWAQQQCRAAVDREWEQRRADMLPRTCGQSFDCTRRETQRYSVCVKGDP
jgi:hypothetical protein